MSTSPKIAPHNALDFLAADHKALLAMFRDYERHKGSASAIEKGKHALRICHRLSIHCAIKEQIFYHAVAAVLGEKAGPLLNQAEARLGALRGQMSKVEHTSSSDESFDSFMKELGDTAHRHFEAEEKELFPLVRHADFDLAGTGEKLATRQAELSTAPAGKAQVREARRVLGS